MAQGIAIATVNTSKEGYEERAGASVVLYYTEEILYNIEKRATDQLSHTRRHPPAAAARQERATARPGKQRHQQQQQLEDDDEDDVNNNNKKPRRR